VEIFGGCRERSLSVNRINNLQRIQGELGHSVI